MDKLSFLYTNTSAPLRRVQFVPARRPDTVAVPEDIDLIYLNPTEQQTVRWSKQPVLLLADRHCHPRDSISSTRLTTWCLCCH